MEAAHNRGECKSGQPGQRRLPRCDDMVNSMDFTGKSRGNHVYHVKKNHEIWWNMGVFGFHFPWHHPSRWMLNCGLFCRFWGWSEPFSGLVVSLFVSESTSRCPNMIRSQARQTVGQGKLDCGERLFLKFFVQFASLLLRKLPTSHSLHRKNRFLIQSVSNK